MAKKRKPKAPARRTSTTRKAKRSTRRKAAARRTPARAATPQRQQPETLRLRSLAPSLTANDLEKSVAWYRDVLGFYLKDRWEEDGKLRGVELVAGAVTFMLSQDDWKKGRDRRKGEGFRLYCSSAQDVDVLAAQIVGRGGKLEHEPRNEPWGGRDFAIVDPDGFRITISTEWKG